MRAYIQRDQQGQVTKGLILRGCPSDLDRRLISVPSNYAFEEVSVSTALQSASDVDFGNEEQKEIN